MFASVCIKFNKRRKSYTPDTKENFCGLMVTVMKKEGRWEKIFFLYNLTDDKTHLTFIK